MGMFLFMFVLLFTPGFTNTGNSNDQNVDSLGHLGGFLTGLWVSAIGTPLISETRETVIRVVFGCCFVVQMLGTFLVFYLSH